MIPCPICDGHGEVHKRQRFDLTELEEWDETCPVCGGAGEVTFNLGHYVGMLKAHNEAQHKTIQKMVAEKLIGGISTQEPSHDD